MNKTISFISLLLITTFSAADTIVAKPLVLTPEQMEEVVRIFNQNKDLQYQLYQMQKELKALSTRKCV